MHSCIWMVVMMMTVVIMMTMIVVIMMTMLAIMMAIQIMITMRIVMMNDDNIEDIKKGDDKELAALNL